MSGRHESWQVRRWAPTALNAVVALVPVSAMLTAVGAAGGGYLLHRADIAAAGAGTAAVGLAMERLQNRSLRLRTRRDRWEWRAEREQLRSSMDELRHDLEDAHHTLNVLRSRIHTLHDRTAESPRPALIERAARQRLARQVVADDAPTMPLHRVCVPAAAPAAPLNPFYGNPFQPSPFRPVQAQPGVAPAAGRPTPAEPERRRPLVTLGGPQTVPGADGWRGVEPAAQAQEQPHPQEQPQPQEQPHPQEQPQPFVQRPAPLAGPATAPAAVASSGALAGSAVGAAAGAGSTSATGRVLSPITLGPLAQPPKLPVLPIGPVQPVYSPGGLPMFPPGPRDPISGPLAIVVDLAEASRSAAPLPSATLPAVSVDALVYAAIDESGADELTVTLERLDDPDRGGRHTDEVGPDGGVVQPSGLVVVGASVVGDPLARARRGRHTA